MVLLVRGLGDIMKKKLLFFIIIIVVLVLLIPIPLRLKDGGSIKYKAILYTIKYHALDLNSETGYIDGIGIKILGMEIYNNTKLNKTNLTSHGENIIKGNVEKDAVMVDGKIYYSTGEKSTITGRCGNMDGEITSSVEKGQLPAGNNQSNFGINYGYQRIDSNTIEVKIENDFIVFKANLE